jgi:hypothetical protein
MKADLSHKTDENFSEIFADFGGLCNDLLVRDTLYNKNNLTGGIFWGIFFLCTVFNTASSEGPHIKFHCVGGCWDRTQDCNVHAFWKK